jgi:hypothetical protein
MKDKKDYSSLGFFIIIFCGLVYLIYLFMLLISKDPNDRILLKNHLKWIAIILGICILANVMK